MIFSEEVVQSATFWFALGLAALLETGEDNVVPSFTVLTATECMQYALEIVYPICVWAPAEPVDWRKVLDEG